MVARAELSVKQLTLVQKYPLHSHPCAEIPASLHILRNFPTSTGSFLFIWCLQQLVGRPAILSPLREIPININDHLRLKGLQDLATSFV